MGVGRGRPHPNPCLGRNDGIGVLHSGIDLIGSPCQVAVKGHSLGDAPVVSCAPRPKVGIEAELVLVEDGDILAVETLATVGCDAQGL